MAPAGAADSAAPPAAITTAGGPAPVLVLRDATGAAGSAAAAPVPTKSAAAGTKAAALGAAGTKASKRVSVAHEMKKATAMHAAAKKKKAAARALALATGTTTGAAKSAAAPAPKKPAAPATVPLAAAPKSAAVAAPAAQPAATAAAAPSAATTSSAGPGATKPRATKSARRADNKATRRASSKSSAAASGKKRAPAPKSAAAGPAPNLKSSAAAAAPKASLAVAIFRRLERETSAAPRIPALACINDADFAAQAAPSRPSDLRAEGGALFGLERGPRVWQRACGAPINPPPPCRMGGRAARLVRGMLPGSFFVAGGPNVCFKEDGIARPVADGWVFPEECCPPPVATKGGIRGNVLLLAGIYHQQLPDGTWRRVEAHGAAGDRDGRWAKVSGSWRAVVPADGPSPVREDVPCEWRQEDLSDRGDELFDARESLAVSVVAAAAAAAPSPAPALV
ncbi:hypothetical protein C8A05DRAFT_31403, partial [Staphylotrichum tortipilum]